MLRKADLEDLDQIMILIKKVVPLMLAQGNPQWDEDYPAKEDFEKDILEDSLFVWEEKSQILGVVCVNQEEPEGYKGVSWIVQQTPTIIHRLAVAPDSRNRGIGTALFSQAEKMARENGTFYLRTDTYSTNQAMNSLMKKLGYVWRGDCFFPDREGPFHCYEKLLQEPAI